MVDKILNPFQKQAVLYDKGPLLIVAGAGTGKTTVLLERIKHLVADKKVKADNMLALTFTQKAAEEMLERLDLVMPLGYVELWISTFHSFCDRILRDDGLEIGLSPDYDILTAPQSWALFKKHLFDFKLKYFRPLGNPNKFIQAILKFFSRAQDEDIGPDEFAKWVKLKKKESKSAFTSEVVGNPTSVSGQGELDDQRYQELAQTYQQWQEIKIAKNVLDFGDLITSCIRLLIQRPNLLAKYQKQFKHILIDEFQDTNFAQLKLIKLLADPSQKPNLVVVGDDFQAIYKWRGAAVSNIMDFTSHYPLVKTVILNQNYRSTQPLLDRTYAFIKHNEPETLEVKLGIDKKLSAVSKEKINPVLIQLPNLEEEADFVADKILELAATKDYSYHDFAVLARANNHLDAFAAALRRRGIPYQLLANRGLFDQEIVRELVFFCRVLLDPSDSVNFFQLMHLGIFNISPDLILSLLTQSRAVRMNLWEHIKEKLQPKADQSMAEKIEEIEEKELKKLEYLAEIVEKYREEVLKKSPSRLLYEFIWETGLIKMLTTEDSIENQLALQNLNLFFKYIKQFEEDNKNSSLIDFLDFLDMMMEAGENPAQAEIEDIDTVSLVTVHSAKGLEWPVVFVVNVVKDRFPTRKRSDAIEFPDELAGEELPKVDSHLLEERRLFYVACTRAKNELFITLGKDYGGKTAKRPSSFVDELGIKLEEKKTDLKQLNWLDMVKREKTKASKVIDGKLQLYFVSYSQLGTFKLCPLKYKYRYVLKVPTRPQHALTFGISIHETLRYFHTLELKHKTPALDDLLFFYRENFQSEGYESEKHKKLRFVEGEEFLKNYFKRYKGIFPGRPVFLEKKFRLNVGTIPLYGKIDRIDKLPDGSYELIDYKTGSAKSQAKANNDEQLTIYAMAAKWVLGVEPKNISLFFIEENKKIDTQRSDEQLKKKFKQIQQTVEEIKQSKFLATPGFPMPCGYCDYKSICPFVKKS